jgi:hypothetical protein
LGENKRTHYAIFRKAKRSDFKTEEEFRYLQVKQNLMIDDLKRYSINAVMIDEYTDVLTILKRIKKTINLNNIFISGSAEEYGEWKKEDAIQLIERITKEFINDNYKIITGFGYGVGSFIVNFAIQYIDDKKYRHYDDYLRIRPFAFQLKENDKDEFNKKYK